MNPCKQVSPYTLVLAYLGICILFSGCVATQGGYFLTFTGQLTSVPQSEPHGTLTVSREEKHYLGTRLSIPGLTDYKNILVKVDGKYVFKEIEGKSATFRLAPGKHEVEAEYYDSFPGFTNYKGGNLFTAPGITRRSPVIKDVVEVKEKGTASVSVFSEGMKIALRCEPRP